MIAAPLACFFAVLLLQRVAAFLSQRKLSRGPVHVQHNESPAHLRHEDQDHKNLLGDESSQFMLPVFPVRKTVRLPTESMTLNLYEERFLAMADESILATSRPVPLFGALYSSNKAQIVKNGTGPIVPLVKTGDVGVIFLVTRCSDDMVLTIGGHSRRRRLRLEAQGAARFQVQSVLHTGYETEEDGCLPYIVVRAQLYLDAKENRDRCDATSKSNSYMAHNETIQQLQAAFGAIRSVEDIGAELRSFELAARCSDANVAQRLAILQLQSTSARFKSAFSCY